MQVCNLLLIHFRRIIFFEISFTGMLTMVICQTGKGKNREIQSVTHIIICELNRQCLR